MAKPLKLPPLLRKFAAQLDGEPLTDGDTRMHTAGEGPKDKPGLTVLQTGVLKQALALTMDMEGMESRNDALRKKLLESGEVAEEELGQKKGQSAKVTQATFTQA
eukprot:15484589-Alexandrium_andersonii.AAC.1